MRKEYVSIVLVFMFKSTYALLKLFDAISFEVILSVIEIIEFNVKKSFSHKNKHVITNK